MSPSQIEEFRKKHLPKVVKMRQILDELENWARKNQPITFEQFEEKKKELNSKHGLDSEENSNCP